MLFYDPKKNITAFNKVKHIIKLIKDSSIKNIEII